MNLIKNVLPFLLALLIVSAGFFGSGAVSRFLPDYTGQVFSGVKQEGIQNAFFSGSGSEVLVLSLIHISAGRIPATREWRPYCLQS